MLCNLSLLTLSCFLIHACHAYRILGVFPMAARSHYFLGSSLMKGLAEAGHDVTIIAPFSDNNPPKNGTWTQIVVEELDKYLQEFLKDSGTKRNIFNTNPFQLLSMLKVATVLLTEKTMNNAKVQDLMQSGKTFDAVIVTEFMCPAMKAFANHFSAHLMLFSNHGGMSWYYNYVGNPTLPSFYPEMILSLPSRMTFIQRLENTFMKTAMALFEYMVILPLNKELTEKYFPNSPDLEDILYNVSLVLVNSHTSINNAQPKVPCMIDIGGFHVKPSKKLPNDLQKFLDDAKEGVIYFSLGSHLKSEDLPADKLDVIMKVFAKRKEKILWKYGEDTLAGILKNVKLGKWFPQQDILAHPNVKLFITHSGFLSTTETIYHGVPVVAIPIISDQKMNAISAVRDGYGVTVFIEDISEEVLSRAVEEVISNPKYKKVVKEKSRLMHDRQNKPIDEAVYWIEYVIRHNGAKHLRVAYLDLAWYEYYLFDVFGLIFVCLLVTIFILKKVISCAFRMIQCVTKRKLKKS